MNRVRRQLRRAGRSIYSKSSIYLNPCQSSRENTRERAKPTSSNGRVSLKQLSHTSLTAFSAAASSGHAGFAFTESTARRLTQSYKTLSHSLIFYFFANARIEKTDLVLLRKRVLAPSQFPSPSTITTQARSADLSFRPWTPHAQKSDGQPLDTKGACTSLHAWCRMLCQSTLNFA